MKRIQSMILVAVVTAAYGCGDHKHDHDHGHKHDHKDAAEAVVLKPDLLQPLVLAAKPDKALSVMEARGKADGETVVVSGVSPTDKVKPFNPALAAFMLLSPEDAAKPEVKEEFNCDDAAVCPRCRQLLDKYALRVELVDAKGAVLPTTVDGFAGIKPGSPITVEGVIKREGKDKKLVRVVATKIFPG